MEGKTSTPSIQRQPWAVFQDSVTVPLRHRRLRRTVLLDEHVHKERDQDTDNDGELIERDQPSAALLRGDLRDVEGRENRDGSDRESAE